MIHLDFSSPPSRSYNHLTCSNARRTRWRLPFIIERHRYYYGGGNAAQFLCRKLKIEYETLLLLCWEGLKVFCPFERLSRGVSEEIWDLFVEVKIVWRNLINIDANAFRILFLETSSFYKYLIALWFSRIANFLQQSIFCDKSESSRFHKFLLRLFYYTSNWILKLNTEDVWYWKQTG